MSLKHIAKLLKKQKGFEITTEILSKQTERMSYTDFNQEIVKQGSYRDYYVRIKPDLLFYKLISITNDLGESVKQTMGNQDLYIELTAKGKRIYEYLRLCEEILEEN